MKHTVKMMIEVDVSSVYAGNVKTIENMTVGAYHRKISKMVERALVSAYYQNHARQGALPLSVEVLESVNIYPNGGGFKENHFTD